MTIEHCDSVMESLKLAGLSATENEAGAVTEDDGSTFGEATDPSPCKRSKRGSAPPKASPRMTHQQSVGFDSGEEEIVPCGDIVGARIQAIDLNTILGGNAQKQRRRRLQEKIKTLSVDGASDDMVAEKTCTQHALRSAPMQKPSAIPWRSSP